jgi:hypothetical protein
LIFQKDQKSDGKNIKISKSYSCTLRDVRYAENGKFLKSFGTESKEFWRSEMAKIEIWGQVMIWNSGWLNMLCTSLSPETKQKYTVSEKFLQKC